MRFSQKKVIAGVASPDKADGYIRDNLICFFPHGLADVKSYDKLKNIIVSNGIKTMETITKNYMAKSQDKELASYFKYTESYITNRTNFEKKFAGFVTADLSLDELAKRLGIEF